ncbi:hypothetical protein B0H17DRAFT_1214483 [Mycena rosella]|uniref:Uncharacterized protein n=1 Tax=Mycena rosella TaxID=1033263 RepID=A0AAD7G315_MYCRO|nr:hypothetical protein B0H17DRAFT_1214483 [Mycena rosella]
MDVDETGPVEDVVDYGVSDDELNDVSRPDESVDDKRSDNQSTASQETVDPLQGGGKRPYTNPVKGRAMATQTLKCVMALEGKDKALEEKLLQCIEYRCWGLNENLMVPACRGKHSDDDKGKDSQKCEICKAYTAHLYMLADERESIAKLNKEKLWWEMVNEIAELINTKANEDLVEARKEKSLLEQKVGRLATKLEDAEDLVKRLESRIDECKDEIDELYEENQDLEEKLTRAEYGPVRDNLKRPRYDAEDEQADAMQEDAEAFEELQGESPLLSYSKMVMCGVSRGDAQKQPEVAMSTATPIPLAQRMAALHAGHPERVDYEQEEKLKVLRDCKRQYMMILMPDVQLPPCDAPPAPGILEEIDTRGFPVDAQTWRFMLWAFGRQVPIADRTPAMELAVNEFYMTDWHALLLGKLVCLSDAAFTEKERLLSLKRDELRYNPHEPALLMQLQESHEVTGCPFVDNCWTLDLRLVCGLSLLEALSLEKLFIELFATPGLYQAPLTALHLTPAARFVPMHWGEDSLATVNLDLVVTAFAHMGVSVSMIDDTFAFGEKWLQQWSERMSPPPEWTNTEVNSLRQAADGIPRPPGFNASHTNDLFPWSPVLPRMSSADTAAAFQLANYRHPELAGMCRQPNSVVQAWIDSGMRGNPPENKGVIPRLNLFLPGNKECSKAARICTAPVPTAGLLPSFTPASNQRKGKGHTAAKFLMPGPISHATAVHPASLVALAFAQTVATNAALFGPGPSSQAGPSHCRNVVYSLPPPDGAPINMEM